MLENMEEDGETERYSYSMPLLLFLSNIHLYIFKMNKKY